MPVATGWKPMLPKAFQARKQLLWVALKRPVIFESWYDSSVMLHAVLRDLRVLL
jgi:predicted secreted protein